MAEIHALFDSEHTLGPLAERIISELTVHEFCELVAHVFHLDARSGHVTIRMSFDAGRHVYSQLESGRIGTDDLANFQLRALTPADGAG